MLKILKKLIVDSFSLVNLFNVPLYLSRFLE